MGGTYNAIRGIPLKRPHLTHVWDLCKFILCFSNGRELAWKTEKKEAKQEEVEKRKQNSGKWWRSSNNKIIKQ